MIGRRTGGILPHGRATSVASASIGKMGKIHTHYDNLKVARLAPQEVIRAAYKALSQKYHPDKNPGDEKAARIMAIVNSAYDTLSDPQRRKEHDEWIAAEEWEIEWLESTRHEDPRGASHGGHAGHAGERSGRHDSERWQPDPVERPARRRARMTRWKWGGALLACVGVGWIGGAVMAEPHWLDSAWGGKGATAIALAQAADGRRSNPAAVEAQGAAEASAQHEASDRWAESRPGTGGQTARPPRVRVLAMSHVTLPSGAGDCDSTGAGALVAPNGEPWPRQSGYIEGFTVGNRGDDMQLMLDNANNASPVFIKVYDIDRRANVRYAYVQAHDKLVVDQLANGKYEIRYQNLDAGSTCAANPASRTAAAARPFDQPLTR